MTIQITYEFKTAYGFPTQNTVLAHSLEEAEALCKRVENIGYKLIDVTTDPYEG